MITQKRLKGKFKGPYVKLRTTGLEKNIVGFSPQGHHLGNFMAEPNNTNFKKVALSMISLLDQLFLILELHHINWLKTW